ncbi:imelysin family protein [Wenyingzhuangia sp. IMCC45467]
MKKIISLILALSLFSCVKENKGDENTIKDDFKRELILSNWVNNIIIPAYTDFKVKMDDLKSKSDAFVANPNTTTQTALQTSLFQAQKVWQHVAMFDIHSDASEVAPYREYMNKYPIDRETSTFPINNSNEDDATLENNLEQLDANTIDFTSSKSTDEQGFPAIDYLINGVDITKFTTDIKKDNYKAYLTKVVNRMVSLTNNVVAFWNNNANSIIANNGSSATASFDVMLNDYINYIEQGFRENKITTPSGYRAGDGDQFKNELAVESYFSADYSKLFYEESFKAIKNLYYGVSYDESTTAESINTYLTYLDAEVYVSSENKDYKINDLMATKFTDIVNASSSLNANFVTQVNTNNSALRAVFHPIQSLVVLIKTNTFQALNVKIDYVDSDGD